MLGMDRMGSESTPRRITDGVSAPVKPISPSDIAKKKMEGIPSFVIEVINELIAQKFTCGRADFTQNEAIDAILARSASLNRPNFQQSVLTRQDLFDKGWLNIEEIYRDFGWKVSYHKPDYTESYAAYFRFEEQ